ncbi:AAA family ATPase [Nonomuraea sp. M3C6]|uniref:AAA family ATPase n=1 Tax=Nonomuraea marmarensis TaxID=3351344 RepID=A0ABW7AM30_9ACTN
MARHDREESLEEQLAWLDAIKETEEAPVPVSASTASADETVASPYPKDPWLLVPTQHETPTPPLFRAAVDSVYGAAAAEDLPEGESEAGEWLDKASTKEAPTAPPAGQADPFLAPLKPLPRPDDTDSYALSFSPPEPEPKDSEKTEEPEEQPWPRPADWSRPAAEPSGQEPPAASEEPARAEESVRTEDKPSAAEDDRVAWADTSSGNERPKWTEQPDTLPRIEPPKWTESETSPANERPQWTEPEARPQRETPEERPQWGEPEERPQWAEEPVQQPERPAWTEQERPAWTERQEWRPAEREIPSPPPQHQPQQPQPQAQPQPQSQPRCRPAPIPVFTAPPRPPITGRPTADSLDPESLLRGRRNAPSKGWRRLVYKASGGWIKPGEPPEVRRRRELVTRSRTPVTTGHHRVAVLSLKGGVGKTTTTVGLGATLAQMRGDRVIAVDANPDRGTLSDKLVLETSATVRDLLNEREQVKRYVDIRAFTSQAPSRLEVLASDRDPSVSEAFSGSDYQDVSQVLENFYSICITDCGTGLLHSAMGGVLGLADQIVLVSSPSVDGARAASATLDWLEAHHYADLVKAATVVLCSVRPRSKSAVDIKKLEAHFAARCRAVIQVPYDPHLEEGAEIDLDRLQEPTREAYLQLAACVGDGFAGLRE